MVRQRAGRSRRKGGAMTSEVRAAMRTSSAPVTVPLNELMTLMEGVAEDAAEKAAAKAGEQAAQKAVEKALFQIGLDISEKPQQAAVRADMDYLRRWRLSYDRMTGAIGNAVVLAVVAGMLAALWVGLKIHVLKQP